MMILEQVVLLKINIPNNMKTILMNIILERTKKGYSQEYMAEKLGIVQKTYCKLEKGRTKLSIERLEEIALILEKDICTLLLD